MNLFTDDLTSTTPDELRKAIMSLASSGVEEKFRLDFKVNFDKDAHIKDVAAFANSYGGLLILGVSDDRSDFPGVPALGKSDLKTQICSLIASRILPTPAFEVYTCKASELSDNLLVLIRVGYEPRVYTYLRGNIPVYVRTDDSSDPIKAHDLLALIERARREGSPFPEPDFVTIPAGRTLTTKIGPTTTTFPGPSEAGRRGSRNVLWIQIVPLRQLRLYLDADFEDGFRSSVLNAFEEIAIHIAEGKTSKWSDRRAKWYQFHTRNLNNDCEACWSLDEQGRIDSKFEVSYIDENLRKWSIADFIVNISRCLELSHEVWKSASYFGSGEIKISISIEDLEDARRHNTFESLFYKRGPVIRADVAELDDGVHEVKLGAIQRRLTYDDRTSKLTSCVADLTTSILRDLRYSVQRSRLIDAIELWYRNNR